MSCADCEPLRLLHAQLRFARISNDKGAAKVYHWLCTMMLDSLPPFRTQVVKPERIMLFLNNRKQTSLQLHELRSIYLALKYGILNSLPVVQTCTGYSP